MILSRSLSAALLLSLGVSMPVLAEPEADPAPPATADAPALVSPSIVGGPDPVVAALLPLVLTPVSLGLAPITSGFSVFTVPAAVASGHVYAGDASRGLLAASLGAGSVFAGGFAFLYGVGYSNPITVLLTLLGIAGLAAPVVAIPLDAAQTARKKGERLAMKASLTAEQPLAGGQLEPGLPRPMVGSWIAGLPAISTTIALNVSDPGAAQILSAAGLGLGYVISGDFQRAAWVSLVGSFFQASLIGAFRGTSILGTTDTVKLTGAVGALAIAGMTAWDSVRLLSDKQAQNSDVTTEAPAAVPVATESVLP
ncbi:MAG: hypothetical protein VKP57_09485 [Candidatus Sericytochromatia bacterium]|nr:hypothetical protein [Candidatus Sericytochromatia bacterium]